MNHHTVRMVKKLFRCPRVIPKDTTRTQEVFPKVSGKFKQKKSIPLFIPVMFLVSTKCQERNILCTFVVLLMMSKPYRVQSKDHP